MAFGMFSSNPFEAFERGYGYDNYNPWTSVSSFQPPSRGYLYRPGQSARRFIRPSSPTVFWQIPVQTDEEEDTEMRNNLAAQRKGKCRKCRTKTAQVHDRKSCRSRPENDRASLHEDSVEVPVEKTNNEHSKPSKDKNSDGAPQKRKVCRKATEGREESSPEGETSALRVQESAEEELERNPKPRNEIVQEIPSKEQESLDEIENEFVQQPQTSEINTSENTESGETHGQQPEVQLAKEEVNQLQQSSEMNASSESKENVADEEKGTEDKSESELPKKNDEIENKLELIEIQLQNARELTPKEVLSKPRTDKKRMYLTEMLLRCILDLDMVETGGNETVKLARREAVREIQSFLDQVENNS